MAEDSIESTPTDPGDIKDKVLEVVSYVDKLEPSARRSFMEELLDHVCWKCGSEMPKYDACNTCGAERLGYV